jgi:hypothetical protein
MDLFIVIREDASCSTPLCDVASGQHSRPGPVCAVLDLDAAQSSPDQSLFVAEPTEKHEAADAYLRSQMKSARL